MTYDFDPDDEREAARSMLTFAVSVARAQISSDRGAGLFRAGNDNLAGWDRIVAAIGGHITGLSLPLRTLDIVARGLVHYAVADWGKLAEDLREDFFDISDLDFGDLVSATLTAIHRVALMMPAETHVDSAARLGIFALGLDVAQERREAIRALLVQDIDAVLGDLPPEPSAVSRSLARMRARQRQ